MTKPRRSSWVRVLCSCLRYHNRCWRSCLCCDMSGCSGGDGCACARLNVEGAKDAGLRADLRATQRLQNGVVALAHNICSFSKFIARLTSFCKRSTQCCPNHQGRGRCNGDEHHGRDWKEKEATNSSNWKLLKRAWNCLFCK